jgi:hypothetical protein
VLAQAGATLVGMSDPGGTLLTTVGSRTEAEMLCGELRANGIKCGYALSDTAGAIAMASGGASNVGPVDVFVEEQKLAEARKLLPADA